MGANTKIEWANMTWNCWRGCSKVSAGCAHCYASTQSKRNPGTLGVWGPNGTRVVAAEAYWRLPERWNRDAGWQESASAAGTADEKHRPRVFCGSLMDWAEDWGGPMVDTKGRPLFPAYWDDPLDWTDVAVAGQKTRPLTMDMVRSRLFRTIGATPNLDYLLVTKRPENARRMLMPWLRDRMGVPVPNLWLLTSVEDQATAEARIPHLLACRDLAPVLGLSVEPLLGPVDLSPWLSQLDWVIVGGESGPHARPCNVAWIRAVISQCKAAGVPCYVKQLGACCVDDDPISRCSWPGLTQFHGFDEPCRVLLRDPKGGDHSEWPEDLRVREFPANH